MDTSSQVPDERGRVAILPGVNAYHPERARHPVVVGVDASAGSRAALRWCAEYADAVGARVVAVHAVDLGEALRAPVRFGDTAQHDGSWRAQVRDEMRAVWCQSLGDRDVEFDCRVEEGSAVAALERVADELDAQLVVVGRDGAAMLAEVVLGSVPQRLAHECRRPLVVVPEESNQ